MSILLFTYSIGIRAYGLLVYIASFFHTKASLWSEGRRDQFSIIKNEIEKWHDAPIIMIHAASYGEYEMSKPIITQLKNAIPHVKIVVSFFSPSGYTNVTFKDSDYCKIYLPLDTLSNQRRLIEIIKPKAVIFIKYDFWFNLLQALVERKIPYYYTSLHLNESSYLFNWIAAPFLQLIRKSRIIFAHNQESEKILRSHSINNVKIIGDTRVDKALENKKLDFKAIEMVNPEKPVIIIGSLTSEDINMVTDYINHNEQYNYIIAPHDIDEVSIAQITNNLSRSYKFLTDNTACNIMIVNTLGDLKFLYRYADIAYVGGGFSKGPHNVIEPLVYGVKVFCGPNIEKFPMAITLNKFGLLDVMESRRKFGKTIEKLNLIDTEDHVKRCDNFIDNNWSRIELLTKDIQAVLDEN